MKSRWLLVAVAVAEALVLPQRRAQRLAPCSAAPLVDVQPSEESVGFELCDVVVREYKKAVKAEGRFSFAISGGSMLKMLSNLEGETAVDWSKCVMGFVSHRCVALDSDGATFKKARPAFLDSWVARGLDVIAPTGTTNAEAEADSSVEAEASDGKKSGTKRKKKAADPRKKLEAMCHALQQSTLRKTFQIMKPAPANVRKERKMRVELERRVQLMSVTFLVSVLKRNHKDAVRKSFRRLREETISKKKGANNTGCPKIFDTPFFF